MDRTQIEGLFFVGMGTLGYAVMGIFLKIIYSISEMQPPDVALWRFTFALPLMWAITLVDGRKHEVQPVPRLPLLGLGAVLGCSALMAFYGLNYLDVSLYSVLFRVLPGVIMIIGLAQGQPIPRNGWYVMAMLMVGVSFMQPDVFTANVDQRTAIGLTILSFHVLLVAGYFIGQGRVMRSVRNPLRASAWSVTGSLLFLSPIILWRGYQSIESVQLLLLLIALGLFCTVVPTVGFLGALSRIGPARTSLINALEPVLTLVLAFTILHERLYWSQFVGATLIIGGVFVLEYSRHLPAVRKPQAAPAAGD